MLYTDSSSTIMGTTQVALKKMLYPPFLEDVLATVLQTNLPLFLVLSFILNVLQMAKNLAYEKENKLKVIMQNLKMKFDIILYKVSSFKGCAHLKKNSYWFKLYYNLFCKVYCSACMFYSRQYLILR